MDNALPTRCSGPLNRRQWLKLGGLSFGALCQGLAPTLPRLLAADQARREAKQPPVDDFSVILFWANGGPSHIDTFDLKPHAPQEYRGPFRPIRTNVPGIEINELLPRLAGMADKFAIVRSLFHERNQHSGGTHRFLSGYQSVAANLADAEYPEIGSVVAEQLKSQARDVPLFVANTKFYGGGPAYLGPAFAPYMPSPNPITSSGNNVYDPVPIYRTPNSDDNLQITSEGEVALSRRRNLLQTLDTLPRTLDGGGMMSAIDVFQRQALEMLASGRMREAFALEREDDSVRRRYGETHWGKSLLTCRRLVEAGVRFVQCQATWRLPAEVGRTSNWDDHSVNSDIFKAYAIKLPHLDQAISALVEDLYQRGLSERVLFLFCGEFGRTPLIRYQDASGRPGRDHWARAMSVFVSGGGLKMGQVIGATSAKAEDPIDRIMDSNNLLATIYHRFGIDTRQSYLTNAGRPIPILTDGEPVAELL